MKYLSSFINQSLIATLAVVGLASWFLLAGARATKVSAVAARAQAAAPSCLSCTAGEGKQLFANGTDVRVKILSPNSALTSDIFLRKGGPNGEEVSIGKNTEINKVITVTAGTLLSPNDELVFGIRVPQTGDTFLMGPPMADRVPDGLAHARIECVEAGTVRISFEDTFGGGDTDFNDAIIEVTCVVNSSCAQCNPGLGGRLFAQGQDLKVTILQSDAAITSSIFLQQTSGNIAIGDNMQTNKMMTVDGSLFSPGAELVFGITIGTNTFLMGEPTRNPDSQTHAVVECVSPGVTRIRFEDTFGGGDGDFNDAIIEVTCIRKCNTFAFHPPQYYLNNLGQMPGGTVLIGGVNSNVPLSTRNVTPIQLALQAGGSFTVASTANSQQLLNREFVAAQLSLNLAGGAGSPVTSNVLWANLGCPGLLGDFQPIPLSNGFVLSPDSMLKDLFIQTQLALQQNRTADFPALTNLFAQLNCDDLFCSFCCPAGSKCPPSPLPNLVPVEMICERVNSRVVNIKITVQNLGTSPARESTTRVQFPVIGGLALSPVQFNTVDVATPSLTVNESKTVTQSLFLPAGDVGSLPLGFPITATVNSGACILETTRLDNVKTVFCQ